VLAGGRSGEHEVSIVSTRSLMKALEGSDLEVTPLVVTKEGRWLPLPDSVKALSDGKATSGGDIVLARAATAAQYDVVFPLIHGPNGEDGTVQGMFELAGIPYVGSGVLASALCMDKVMCKDVLATHGVPQVRYGLVTRAAFDRDADAAMKPLLSMGPPWFVKPANLGSSIGVSKAKSEDDLRKALGTALQHDRRAIVEQGLQRPREIEIGILGNDEPIASPVGEITFDAEWYDYATKYTEGRSAMQIPAKIPPEVAQRVRDIALTAYRRLDCAGFARVDFFFTPSDGQVYLNELNTIPGFTPFSMFTKLWEAAGMSYAQVVKRLVELALERHRA
jgi:D-alanine-D-alanine ligase